MITDPLEVGKALATFGGGAYGLTRASRLGERVLGPSLDAIGAALGRYTEFRLRNVGRIVEEAELRLGERAVMPGAVAPRVAATVFEEGSWTDDEVMVEYFGGILASSRSESGRDDRGAMWAQVVSHMSSYQIRGHYLIYPAVKRSARSLTPTAESGIALDSEELINQLRVHVPAEVAGQIIDPGSPYVDSAIIVHTLNGLAREGLVSGPFGYQELDHVDHSTLPDWVPDHKPGGVYAAATFSGLELFLWAHGVGATPPQSFLDHEVQIDVDIPECHVDAEGFLEFWEPSA